MGVKIARSELLRSTCKSSRFLHHEPPRQWPTAYRMQTDDLEHVSERRALLRPGPTRCHYHPNAKRTLLVGWFWDVASKLKRVHGCSWRKHRTSIAVWARQLRALGSQSGLWRRSFLAGIQLLCKARERIHLSKRKPLPRCKYILQP